MVIKTLRVQVLAGCPMIFMAPNYHARGSARARGSAMRRRKPSCSAEGFAKFELGEASSLRRSRQWFIWRFTDGRRELLTRVSRGKKYV
jgi:hypothetical protein